MHNFKYVMDMANGILTNRWSCITKFRLCSERQLWWCWSTTFSRVVCIILVMFGDPLSTASENKTKEVDLQLHFRSKSAQIVREYPVCLFTLQFERRITHFFFRNGNETFWFLWTHWIYIPCLSGRGRELVVPRTDEYDQKSPFEDKDFDEDAFLSGKIPIFNEAPQERPAKGKLYLFRLCTKSIHEILVLKTRLFTRKKFN